MAAANENISGVGDSLIEAATEGDSSCVRQLIKKGADVNWSDTEGNTALIQAAGNGHTDYVKALVEVGADVNKSNKEGTTALITSACNIECLKRLLSAGANVNTSDDKGMTAPMKAVEAENLQCLGEAHRSGSRYQPNMQ